MNQVHKENLTTVENALPNRSAPDIEIFGMEGIPDDVMQQHNQRVSHEFFAAEADRRAATGNPVPGSSIQGAAGTKKPKLESPAELKARLAEHKARKAAEKSGLGSAPDTPVRLSNPALELPKDLPATRAMSLLLLSTSRVSLRHQRHKLPAHHLPRTHLNRMLKLPLRTANNLPLSTTANHNMQHLQDPSRQVSLVPNHPFHPHSLMADKALLRRLFLLPNSHTRHTQQVLLNTRMLATLHP